jgi:hypothetical protein
MTSQQTALEHLQVIRSLMEKEHIYRAISAPAALIGGLLATSLSGWTIWISAIEETGHLSSTQFLAFWLGLFAVCTALNTALLAKQATQRSQPLVSPDMKLALRTLSPALGAGGVMGICFAHYWENQAVAALTWIVCYALALLATSGFSPRSLRRLGWAFLAAGLSLFTLWSALPDARVYPHDEAVAATFMGLTFGLLHIAYGVAVWIRKPQPEHRFE